MPTILRSFNTALAIPDSNSAGVTANLNVFDVHVPTGATNLRLEVQNLNVTHTFIGDLIMTLIDPDGNQDVLSNRRGGTTENFTNATFSDSATTAVSSIPSMTGTTATGPFIPEAPLSALVPGRLDGTWKLKISDNNTVDTGTLQSFKLAFLFDYSGTVTGTGAGDSLKGSDDADIINGLGGNDFIRGFDGNDIITGGRGLDVMLGEAGQDRFVYKSINDTGNSEAKRDVIFDFTHLQDIADLKKIDANTAKAGDQAFKFIGAKAFHGVAGELHFIKVTHADAIENSTVFDRFVLEGDVNGDGKSDFQIEFSNITGSLTTLTKADFIL